MEAVLTALENRLDAPTSRGLAHAVSRAIRDEALRPGDQLPPIRTVASELRLSPTTVSAAWALLARAGTIRTDGRRGTTVAEPTRVGSPRYERALDRHTHFALDLSTGVPDAALLPSLEGAFAGISSAAPGSYLDDPVLPELLDQLRGDWPYDADELTVVDGAMDGVELATRVLVRFGDRVVVEQPAFPPLLDLLEANGAEVVAVPLDEQGMSLHGLIEAIRTGPVSVVYLQPRAQNPTGVSLTEGRAKQLAEALANTDTVVIEDDSSGAVATSAPLSLGRWLPGRTVHVRSFAKSHGPDLRLAALSGPAEIVGRITALRRLGQGWSSRLLQRVLLHLLTDPGALAAVARARVEYARRRQALVAALAEHGIETNGSDGINLWIPVEDETAAVVRLASQGIGVAPGAPFMIGSEQRPHIRVTCGLVRDGHADLAATLAAAARGSVRVQA